MPYEWTTSENSGPDRDKVLRLWPYRSLPRRGFAAMILGFFAMASIPLAAMVGTMILWGLLPFVLLALAGLWWGLERSYRDGEILEELTLAPTRLDLVRTEPNGAIKTWSCNSYWARLSIHPKGGPVEHYLTLKGDSPREVEIGSFLSVPERKALYSELSDVLQEIKAPRN